MAKKAILILAEGFEEVEAVAPIDLLRRAGVEVTVAGLGETIVQSARGLKLAADVKADAFEEDYDAVVLPGGGGGAEKLAASKDLGAFLQRMHAQGRLVAAICASPVLVLAPLGLLDGKSATCYRGMEGGFPKGVRYKNEKVVIEGNLITSAGPATAVEFALAIIDKLCGRARSDQVRAAVLADN